VTPEAIVLGVIVLAVTCYALFGGADFGAGVWEFSTRLKGGQKERALIYRAIGPVWEANHVWLIFVLVGLWTGFPIAFAALCRALWLPLFLALLGIVFRGAAFAFRSYAQDADQRLLWEWVFAAASVFAPFFLGASVGALASGTLAVDASGGYSGSTLTGWLSLTSFFAGLFAVAACGHLAAVYLTREAHQTGDVELTELWRRRALGAGLAMGLLSWVGLGVVATDAPALWEGFRARAVPLVFLSALGGFGSLGALAARRYLLATGAAALALGAVVWGWAAAQYPFLIPPAVTIEAAKAPDSVLWPTIWIVAAGSVLLVPALGYLFWLFKTSESGD
jgi:cytochrome bd ubiquinol oxidase subunit II